MHPHHCEESTPLWKVIQKDDYDKDDAESNPNCLSSPCEFNGYDGFESDTTIILNCRKIYNNKSQFESYRYFT